METQKRRIGNIGEDLSVKFLVKHGYVIIDRNYLKPFGEIDIICRKDGILHFVEVKTVSRKTSSVNDSHRPEDNVHYSKLKRIGRTIQSYLFEYSIEAEWKFDVITVELDHDRKSAHIMMLADLVI